MFQGVCPAQVDQRPVGGENQELVRRALRHAQVTITTVIMIIWDSPYPK